MTFASEALINEHSWLMKGSEILEDMTEELERGATVEIEDLRQIVMFFQLLAEKCHYPKEEQYYFELVRAHGDENAGLLDHLIDEHNLGRMQLRVMQKASEREKLDKQEFINAAYGYIGILGGHMEAEQYELFPLGDEIIPKDKQVRLLQLFERFDREVLGTGAYEKLYELFRQLEQAYSRGRSYQEEKELDRNMRMGVGRSARASR
jgi:hemerythrin-like domain-containing protein